MTELEYQNLACALSALTVFRGVLKQPPMEALLRYLRNTEGERTGMELYGAFVYALAEDDYSLSAFLKRAVLTDENACARAAARRKGREIEISSALRDNMNAELQLFSRLTRLTPEDLCTPPTYQGYIPKFENEPVDFASAYAVHLTNIRRVGYGIFASATMFRVDDGGNIIPIRTADAVTQDRFVGYDEQRGQVFENTRALMKGKHAANVLLYGDAGTGKSSTVKAVANYYAKDGLRLIELRKDQLFALPRVMGAISDNPLKFIVFIDDLSFNSNDDSFSMLKAALEGSAAAKAENAVIYATSNRRHIIKESFSDRDAGDDVHRRDTMQELVSLSDRFGLTVYFPKPGKAEYLEIVRTLARRAGLKMERPELEQRAEAFALARGSRSPRAAEQFISQLKAE